MGANKCGRNNQPGLRVFMLRDGFRATPGPNPGAFGVRSKGEDPELQPQLWRV